MPKDHAVEEEAAPLGGWWVRGRFLIWALMIACWLVDGLSQGRFVNGDAISYFDIATECLKGNWRALVNAYWSPGYPTLLSIWWSVFGHSLYWEPLVVSMLDCAILIGALVCLEYFLAGVFSWIGNAPSVGDDWVPLSTQSVRAICYALFFWITIHLHAPSDHRPDTLVMTLMLLSGGIILRIANDSSGWWHFAALGVTLGLGYLSKAVMFPLSFVFLAAAFLAGRASRRVVFGTTCALIVFLMVSGPFVLALSRSKQRFTFGDVGRLAYAENVNQVRPFAFWQGETPGLGTPIHPARQIFSMPPVFEFATPVGGSYPPLYDQSYWYDGIRPHFSLRGELYELRIAGETLEQLFLVELGTLTAGFLILLFWQPEMREVGRRLARNMFIWGPAVAGMGLYSLVMIGDRYLGGLLLLLCAGLFASLKTPRANWARNLVRAVALTVVLTLSAQAAWVVARDVFLLPRMNDAQDWYVAQALHADGIPAGAYVADFDPGWFTIHYWARLGQMKIVAEIPADNVNDFWQANPAVQAQAMQVIARTGARAVVARNVPAAFLSRGWTPVPRTTFSIRLLRSLSVAEF